MKLFDIIDKFRIPKSPYYSILIGMRKRYFRTKQKAYLMADLSAQMIA